MGKIADKYDNYLGEQGLIMVEAYNAVSWLEDNGYLQPQETKEQSDCPASPVQQLKAEIAKILSNATKMTNMDGYITVAFDETSFKRLEQLSAD